MMKLIAKTMFVGLALVALAGCGGDDKGGSSTGSGGGGTEPSGGASEGGGGKTAYDAAAHKGSISGMVKFSGDKPDARMLTIAGDDLCVTAWKDKEAFDERFVTNADGSVPNAVVYASKGPHGDFTYEVPGSDAFSLSQKDCRYVPHTFAVMVGQTFIVGNDDDTLHNVKYVTKRNGSMNKAQNGGQQDEFVFKKREGKIAFGCDVHSWMSANAFVLEHPFSSVTGEDGKFSISGLPDGEYTFKAWHETFGEHTFTATVSGGAVTQDITLAKK